MQKYESYKDSGIKWIGEIPSTWDICRLKSYCSLKGRIGWNGLRSDEFQTNSYAYLVTGQDFNSSDIVWDKCYQIDKDRYDEDPFIQLSNGDLLITKDGTIGKIAKVSGLDKPACLNSGIFVMKQKKQMYSQGYLYWLLCSNMLKDFNAYTSTGTTILHLYQNVFENMPMLVPSLEEQDTIAKYLDSKCSKIDNLISAQQKRIDLLKELKQSVITRAVTRGINPNVKMKDSGVEWIGEIPEHWDVMKTNMVFPCIGSGTTPSTGNDEYYSENGFNWLQTGDLNDGIITNTTKKITQKALNECSLRMYPEDSLVIALYGATIGKVGLLRIKTATNQACCVLTPSKKMDTSFAQYVFLTAKQSLIIKSVGGGQPNISQEIVKQHRIPVPPLTEQVEIVSYLKKKTNSLDCSIANAYRQIELLKEYKQSLITEVVTGKRKVF